MKTKPIWTIIPVIALLLTIACSQPEQGQPQQNSQPQQAAPADQPTTDQASGLTPSTVNQPDAQQQPDQTNAAAPSPVSNPAPTAVPAPQETTGQASEVADSSGQDAQVTNQPAGPGQEPTTDAEAEQPMATSPKFDETDQIQATYQSMDMEAFALDPNIPYTERQIPDEKPFEEYWSHPYIHLFPDMMEELHLIKEQAESNGQSHPKAFRYAYHSSPEFPRKEYTIETFLHHPWFEPWHELLYTSHYSSGEVSGSYTAAYKTIGTPYFGRDSTREILAETVSQLITNSLQDPLETYIHTGFTDGNDYPDFQHPAPEDIMRVAFHRQSGPSTLENNLYPVPQVHWQFLHPELPIIRVAVVYENISLPYRSEIEIQHDIIPSPSQIVIEFVIAFQHRWTSFTDPNRWALKFNQHMQPLEVQPGTSRHCGPRPHTCQWTHRNGALDEKLQHKFPNYWHQTDYMQHSLIGPVVLTVTNSLHLKPGTHAATPAITQWQAPGPILQEQNMLIPTITINQWERQQGEPLTKYQQSYPFPNSPNPGYPLPGHILTYPTTAPGTPTWESYNLGQEWD